MRHTKKTVRAETTKLEIGPMAVLSSGILLLLLQNYLGRLGVELQAHIAHVGRQRLRTTGLQCFELGRQRHQWLYLGVRIERLDLHGTPGLDDLLIGSRLRQT